MAANGEESSAWPRTTMGTGGPLVFVLALLALFRVSAPQGADAGKAKAPAAEQASKTTIENTDGALKPLYDYLRISDLEKTADRGECLAPYLTNKNVEVLIATLPDPRRSLVGSMFDSSLGAIQRAVETEGYSFDRCWFPWDLPESSSKAKTPQELDYFLRFTFELLAKSKKEPSPSRLGSVLFRGPIEGEDEPGRGVKKQNLLLLLIVPETPTSGIDKEAFSDALDIANCLAKNDNDPVRQFRVIGPTFSGSMESLARTIQAWRRRSAKASESAEFWVCTGSATNVNKRDFERLAGGKGVRYTATVIPDAIILEQVVGWLSKRNAGLEREDTEDKEKIALLTESVTGYGVTSMHRHEKRGTNTQSESRDHQQKANEEQCKVEGRAYIQIPFPFHISQVRGSTGNKARDQFAGQQPGHVPIPIDEVPDYDKLDLIPSMTPKMTAASDSLLVSNILTTLSRNEIRYVGIRATDVLDVVFLTGLIREHMPDVQIILLGSDLRYTDPEFTLDFRGAIVGSSYPLDAFHQLWSRPGNARLFVTDFELGSYNATLVLLNANKKGKDELLVEVVCKQPRLVAYGPTLLLSKPSDSKNGYRPSIWINQVGQHKLWPLKAIPFETVASQEDEDVRLLPAILDGGAQKADAESVNENQANNNHRLALNLPMIFKLAALGLIVIGIVLVVSWFNTGEKQTGGGKLRYLSLWNDACKCDTACSAICLFLISTAIVVPCCAMLRAIVVLLRAGCLAAHFWDRFAIWLILILLSLNLLALYYIVVYALCWLISVGRKESKAKVTRREVVIRLLMVVLALLCTVVCAGVVAVSGMFPLGDGAEDVLFAIRDIELDSGVSPILSALFLALGFGSMGFCGLTWQSIRRSQKQMKRIELNIFDRSIWRPRIRKVIKDSRSDIILADVISAISKSWVNIVFASVVVVLVTLTTVEIYHRSVGTLEVSILDFAFVATFGLYLLFLAYLLAQFVTLWRRLSRLFHKIADLPLAAAFERLPERARHLFGRFVPTNNDLAAGLKMFDQAEAQLPAVNGRGDHRGDRLREALPGLARWWGHLPVKRAFDAPSESKDEGSRAASAASESSQRAQMEAVEDTLLLFLVLRIRPFAFALRSLAVELTISPILLLMSTTCYPYQPQQLTAALVWAFIAVAMATIFIVYVKVDRNEFVSRVSGTTANSVTKDWTFLSNVLTYLVPAFTVFLVTFPGISYWLRSVLGPLSRAMK